MLYTCINEGCMLFDQGYDLLFVVACCRRVPTEPDVSRRSGPVCPVRTAHPQLCRPGEREQLVPREGQLLHRLPGERFHRLEVRTFHCYLIISNQNTCTSII